jgi:hypothetical protein
MESPKQGRICSKAGFDVIVDVLGRSGGTQRRLAGAHVLLEAGRSPRCYRRGLYLIRSSFLKFGSFFWVTILVDISRRVDYRFHGNPWESMESYRIP